MRIKLARKGFLPQIVKSEYDQLSDRSTAEWKTNDLKALGVIAGDVSITYQVYIRGEFLTATDAWTLLEEQFNRKTLKNRLIVTKKLNNFKMEPEPLDETRQLVLLLGGLNDEYKMISTVLENTPNITLAYAIQALSGVTASDELPSAQEKAFAAKKRNPGGKHRFGGKYFYCKKQRHKEFECRKKKSDEERGQIGMAHRLRRKLSVRDMFVSMKDLKTPVRTTIVDGTKIGAVATGTVSLKLMDGTTVSLSDVLYIPEVEGSLISAKLAEKNVVAQFSKDKCVFRYVDAKVMDAMRCGNVYKLKTVGDEVCNVATTPRKEPWAVVHARLGHIPFKRYEQLLTMADRVPESVNSDAICAGCCMGKMRADGFPRYPEKLVKSAGVLDLVHT
ncbi:putative Polyprotein, partial [Phytophthora palmivora]